MIILASQSPQRSMLLKKYGIEFETMPANINEKIDKNLSPEKNTENLALQKAKATYSMAVELDLLKNKKNVTILASDTIVVSPFGKILGKAKDRKEAKKMLTEKSGKTEKVITGYCIMKSPLNKENLDDLEIILGHDISQVHYQEFSEKTLQKILDSNEWKNVAGALRIEGEYISKIINNFEGDMENIIGLPVRKILPFIKK